MLCRVRDDIARCIGPMTPATMPEWFIPWHELVIDNFTRVGSGGFGNVYRAKWLESEVVVKLLDRVTESSGDHCSFATAMSSYSTAPRSCALVPNDREEQKKMREMFAREVSVWFGLSHPHVVRLFGACHIGTQFFACEFAGNGSLDKYLRKHSDELWQKLYEAALGVQYLHSRGIVHGDLKCNNVLIGGDGKAKVTDFGLSYDSALLDKGETQMSGAWHWVAPECLMHGASQLSAASDVYSLGMCIVEALRIVEMTRLELDASTYSPLPWGNLDNVAVKYHVVQKGVLPLRPQLATDDEWALVTRMCAYDQIRRLKISTVVDELEKLANGHSPVSVKGKMTTVDQVPQRDSVLETITQLKSDASSSFDATSTERTALGKIFGLLWDRLDHLSSVVTADGGDVDSLRGIVAKAKSSTMKLPAVPDTLIHFTEMAMRGYALHRSLDKLVAKNFWSISGDGGEVHDWKSRCVKFLGVTDQAEDMDTPTTH